MSKKPRITTTAPLTVNAFAALGQLAGVSARNDASTHTPPEAKSPMARAAVALLSGKLVVAKSRKGRGGRTVVAISGLRGTATELGAFVSAIKRALGCGAVLEGETVLVQGDQCERVRDYLLGQGARQVVVGT